MTKSKKAAALVDRPRQARTKIRGPFDRQRLQISFPEVGRTKQSFKNQCDIDDIVARFQKTGVLPQINPITPQYGDAPDLASFEAACITAEVASKYEEGYTPILEEKKPETATEEVSEIETPEKTTTEAEKDP